MAGESRHGGWKSRPTSANAISPLPVPSTDRRQQSQSRTGRYQSEHDPLVLLAVIAHVLRAADPDAPHTVTQRAYDRARHETGHAYTPHANKLVATFGVGWTRFKTIALDADDPATTLVRATQTQQRRVLTLAEASAALALVASRLGVEVLTGVTYDREREVIDAAMARRHRHGRHLIALPSSGTISRGPGLSRALAAAGLRSPRLTTRPALDRSDAVRVFVDHFGFLPTREDLDWFGRAHGIQLVTQGGASHGIAVTTARAQAVGLGRWFPDRTPGSARPARARWEHLGTGSTVIDGLAREYPRKRTSRQPYTLDDCQQAIGQAFALLGPGERLTADRYRALASAHGLVSYGKASARAKDARTTFAQLVRDEAARRAQSPSAPV